MLAASRRVHPAEHADQAEVRSLVTWGNYAWVYYHLGRFAEAQLMLTR